MGADDDLERLAEFRDRGLISEAEFEQSTRQLRDGNEGEGERDTVLDPPSRIEQDSGDEPPGALADAVQENNEQLPTIGTESAYGTRVSWVVLGLAVIALAALVAQIVLGGGASSDTATTDETTTTRSGLSSRQRACVEEYAGLLDAAIAEGTVLPIHNALDGSTPDGNWLVNVYGSYRADLALGHEQAVFRAVTKIRDRCGVDRTGQATTTTTRAEEAKTTTSPTPDTPEDLWGVNVIPRTPRDESLDSILARISTDLASLAYGDPWDGDPPPVSCDSPGESPIDEYVVECSVQGFSSFDISIFRTSDTTAEWRVLRYTGDS